MARSTGSSSRAGRSETRRRRPGPFGRPRGFTLVELLVTVVVLSVLTLLTVPAFLAIDARRKLEGSAEQTSVLLRRARYDAIRHSQPRAVAVDPGAGVLFIDRDGDQVLDQEEGSTGIVRLPRGVTTGGPVADAAVVEGFSDLGGALHVAVFEPTGSLRSSGGAFRLRDDHENFLEVRVADPATASVVLRKWRDGAWWRKGEGGAEWRWQS